MDCSRGESARFRGQGGGHDVCVLLENFGKLVDGVVMVSLLS